MNVRKTLQNRHQTHYIMVNYFCITNFPLNVISFKQNSFAYVVVLCNNKSLAELLTLIILGLVAREGVDVKILVRYLPQFV